MKLMRLGEVSHFTKRKGEKGRTLTFIAYISHARHWAKEFVNIMLFNSISNTKWRLTAKGHERNSLEQRKSSPLCLW